MAETKKKVTVVTGAYRGDAACREKLAELKKKKCTGAHIIRRDRFSYVATGEYDTAEEAKKAIADLKAAGVNAYVLAD